jgi:hypothetical protein
MPEDYIEVAFLPKVEFGNAEFVLQERKRIEEHMKRTGGNWSTHEHGGSCAVCGNVQVMTHVVFYHEKSNTYVRVGWICADKVGMSYNKEGFNLFRAKLADERMHRAGRAKAEALIMERDAQCPEDNIKLVWDWYMERVVAVADGNGADQWETMSKEQRIAEDMVTKLVKYGNLSDKQWDYLSKLPTFHFNGLRRKEQWAAKRAEEAAISTYIGNVGDRLDFTAKIRFAKFIETDGGFGYRSRWSTAPEGFMLTVMADDAGNVIVWKGKGFDNVEKGQSVTFKATVKAHNEREGVKQTIVTRAKEIVAAA